MFDIEFYAQREQEYRETVVYPRAALLGPFDRELERERARRGQSRPRPARWVGGGLAGAGRRLTGLGEWLAAQPGDAVREG